MDIIDILSVDFGIKVRKKLLDIGMTQLELSKKVGISDAYICEILNDKKEALDIRRKIVSIINTKESLWITKKPLIERQ